MAEKMAIELKKVEGKKCPPFRTSYVNVFVPKAFEDQEAKYSLVMLFDKKTDLKELKRAAQNAKIEKWGSDKAKWPRNLKSPFRDGDVDRADKKGYAGMTFVTASSKSKPQVVDQRRKILGEGDEDIFYSGCWARASLIAFAYDKKGNVGVAFALQNVQKVKDDEKFSGRVDAEAEFDDVEDGSDDAENYNKDSSEEDF